MATILITAVTSQEPGDLSFASWGKGRVLAELERVLGGLSNGSFAGSLDVQKAPAYASQTYTISGGSGTETAIIGGISVAVTWATSDANTATLLAAAINADATAKTYVSAVAVSNVCTVTALVPGTMGNGITTTATGTGNAAGGARLAGGTGAPGNSFTC